MTKKRKPTIKIDVEVVREILDYDKDTGKVTWKPRKIHHTHWPPASAKTFNTRNAGKEAGYHRKVQNRDYTRHEIKLPQEGQSTGTKSFIVARVIWAWMTGEWPEKGYYIDHIDQDPTNNRWDNLRLVSPAENGQNYRRRKDNTSGVTGVSYDSARGLWKHDSQFNKIRYVSMHNTQEDAIAHRIFLSKYLGFSDYHGTTKEERERGEMVTGSMDIMSGVYHIFTLKEWVCIKLIDGEWTSTLHLTEEEANEEKMDNE